MKNLKKKIFISYRFSGEDLDALKTIMDKITDIISKKGYDFFCSFYKEDYFKEHKLTKEQRYDYYKQNIIDSDIIFFFIKTADKSGGMEFELNHAIKHRKKRILVVKNNLDFSVFRENAHDIVEYNNIDQFYEILKHYDF